MNATSQDEKPAAEQQAAVLATKEKLRAAYELAFGRTPTDEETEKLWQLREELTGPPE